MREKLFKAKRIDNGEWVEGFLFLVLYDGHEVWCIGSGPLSANDYSEIIGENTDWFIIDEKSICEYIGLEDKNGKRIWENDILYVVEEMASNTYSNGKLVSSNCWTNKSNFKVEFTPGGLMNTQRYSNSPQIECSVIGNIFDNPELLGQDGG